MDEKERILKALESISENGIYKIVGAFSKEEKKQAYDETYSEFAGAMKIIRAQETVCFQIEKDARKIVVNSLNRIDTIYKDEIKRIGATKE